MSAGAAKNLSSFIGEVCTDSHLRVEKDLGDGYFQLRATEAQRRQAAQDIRCSEDIVIEMLRNSRDADAKNIYIATGTSKNIRSILVIDDGQGIPKAMHSQIFEPYVTSKLDTMTQDKWGVHGRGMALYSIKMNTESCSVIKSGKDLGAAIQVKTNTVNLAEKVDQSTFPDFYIDASNLLTVRGPKNIIRTICEFAIENHKTVNVYYGSFTEIAATLSSHVNNGKLTGVFDKPTKKTKVVDLLKYAHTPEDFEKTSAGLGIEMSTRTARRILNGEIKPLKTVIEQIVEHGVHKAETQTRLNSTECFKFSLADIKLITNKPSKPFKLHLQDDDKQAIAEGLVESFKPIAEKYYLDTDIHPSVSVKKGKISISFNVNESS